MAFGKAIAAEPLDLLETALGEVAFIAARRHPFDHLGLEILHLADIAEGRHRAPQPVGIDGGKIRCDDRQLHRLFLEQRHAERLAEHLAQLAGVVRRCRRRKLDRFATLSSPEIGVNHVALNRAGPHDRDLDDQIVEFARAQPGQHVDLRAALDLEHADTVAPAQHVIDGGVVLWNGVERVIAQPVRTHQIEALANACQHAERQDIDLHQAERVDIVLVPFDEGPVGHGGIVDGHQLVEPPLGQHETADMLRQMAREMEQTVDQQLQPLHRRIVEAVARLGKALLLHRAGIAAPYRRADPVGDIVGEAEHLPHLAHRAAWTVMNDGRGDAGAVAAVTPVDILHHLLAAFMFEIDVDIGRLATFLGDEAREQQVVFHRIDRGDAEQIAHRRIGRRAASLA